MRKLRLAAGSVALVWLMVGCGGGGGGGGGGVGVSGAGASVGTPTAIGPEAPATDPGLASAPKTTVRVNGKAATADAQGRYPAPAGGVLEVSASPDALWTPAIQEAGPITLRNVTATPGTWSAQPLNASTEPQPFSISVSAAAGASESTKVAFVIAGADARNGDYRVFGGNAVEFRLAVNFDSNTYQFTGVSGGSSMSGDIVADPVEPGTYRFKDTLTETMPGKTARFRVTKDAIVGGYPLPMAGVSNSYAYVPFVAARSFVTAQSDLTGTYNRLELTISSAPMHAPATLRSAVRQVKISAGGTELLKCDEVNTISRIDSCAGPLVRFVATPGQPDGTWTFVNVNDASDKEVFSVARVGGENILVHTGTQGSLFPSYTFRIGLPESPAWSDVVARGADALGGWGNYVFTASTFTGTATVFDGTSKTSTFGFANAGPAAPLGLRLVYETPGVFFAVKSNKLLAMIGGSGATSGWFGGYLQLALVE